MKYHTIENSNSKKPSIQSIPLLRIILLFMFITLVLLFSRTLAKTQPKPIENKSSVKGAQTKVVVPPTPTSTPTPTEKPIINRVPAVSKKQYGGWYWQQQLGKAQQWMGTDSSGKDVWIDEKETIETTQSNLPSQNEPSNTNSAAQSNSSSNNSTNTSSNTISQSSQSSPTSQPSPTQTTSVEDRSELLYQSMSNEPGPTPTTTFSGGAAIQSVQVKICSITGSDPNVPKCEN